MYLDYNLDIEKNSVWKIATPAPNVEPFPFVVNEIGLFYAKQDYYTQRAEKSDYLLLFTIAGEGELTCLDQCWPLTPGSACLIDCYRPHSYRTAPCSQDSWTFYWMHVSTAYGRQYFELINGKGFRVLQVGMGTEWIDCFLRAFDLIDYATGASRCQLSHSVSSVLSYLAACCQGASYSPAQDQTVQRAIEYLKQHFDQPLDLGELTHALSISKYYFIRLFSKHTGVTPYQYLIMQRTVKAKQLLRTTDYKVSEIGRAVGFLDESNFSRTFSRLTGMTPSEYRKTD